MAIKRINICNILVTDVDDTLISNIIETDGIIVCEHTPVAANQILRYQDVGAGGLAAPNSASFIVVALSGDLTNERRLQVGNGLNLDDGGANGDLTVEFDPETDVGELTDNSGGTANSTIQALTDPTDLPLTADALRDDLVANLIPELRNNFADLTAKVNAIRNVLQAMGITV